jgi:hypothetical protein
LVDYKIENLDFDEKGFLMDALLRKSKCSYGSKIIKVLLKTLSYLLGQGVVTGIVVCEYIKKKLRD